MFFTRKTKERYDAAIASVATSVADTAKTIEDRITVEVAKLDDRIGAALAELKKEAESVEYPEPKRVTENDEAAAQRESA